MNRMYVCILLAFSWHEWVTVRWAGSTKWHWASQPGDEERRPHRHVSQVLRQQTGHGLRP